MTRPTNEYCPACGHDNRYVGMCEESGCVCNCDAACAEIEIDALTVELEVSRSAARAAAIRQTEQVAKLTAERDAARCGFHCGSCGEMGVTDAGYVLLDQIAKLTAERDEAQRSDADTAEVLAKTHAAHVKLTAELDELARENQDLHDEVLVVTAERDEARALVRGLFYECAGEEDWNTVEDAVQRWDAEGGGT